MPTGELTPALLEIIQLLAEAAVEEFVQEHETGETRDEEKNACP